MESIERAIRNAFAKADAHNPATRQRIYESAWGAHERALATNTALSDGQKEQRRQKLKDAISGIEQEFKTGTDTSNRREPSLDAPHREDPVLGDRTEDAAPALDTGDIRATARQTKRSNADLGYEGASRARIAGKRNAIHLSTATAFRRSYWLSPLSLAIRSITALLT